MSRLFDALEERFYDRDEIKDVANHGCSGGVGGFIYYTELRSFFFKYEDEIEDYIQSQYGFECFMDCEYVSINDIICKAVWLVVECYCSDKLHSFEAVA